MKKRMPIQLEPRQAAALKRIARDRGVSMAALIREALDELLRHADSEDPWERFMSLAGAFRSGLKDGSVNHDRYLDEGKR